MANHNSYYGKDNPNYKPKVCERAEHYRQTAKHGKASDHMCARCHKRRATQWARQKGGGFKAFCDHCHHEYDHMIDNIQKHDSRYN